MLTPPVHRRMGYMYLDYGHPSCRPGRRWLVEESLNAMLILRHHLHVEQNWGNASRMIWIFGIQSSPEVIFMLSGTELFLHYGDQLSPIQEKCVMHNTARIYAWIFFGNKRWKVVLVWDVRGLPVASETILCQYPEALFANKSVGLWPSSLFLATNPIVHMRKMPATQAANNLSFIAWESGLKFQVFDEAEIPGRKEYALVNQQRNTVQGFVLESNDRNTKASMPVVISRTWIIWSRSGLVSGLQDALACRLLVYLWIKLTVFDSGNLRLRWSTIIIEVRSWHWAGARTVTRCGFVWQP